MEVTQDLEFDVPGPFDEAFRIDIGSSKSLLRLVPCRLERLDELFLLAHDAHASTPAASRSLDDQGVPDLLRRFFEGLFVFNDALGAGHGRQASGLHLPAGAVFFTHQAEHGWVRTDKCDSRGFAHLGKVRVFGKKPVAGVNCVHVGDFRSADDVGDVQIAFAASRRADAKGLVGKSHVERIAVRLRIHGDSRDSQLLARTDDTKGDFPSVGDQNFAEHHRRERLFLPARPDGK